MEIDKHPSYPLLLAVQARLEELDDADSATCVEYAALRLLEDALDEALRRGSVQATKKLAWAFGDADDWQGSDLHAAVAALRGGGFR